MRFIKKLPLPWWVIVCSKLLISEWDWLRKKFEKHGFFKAGRMEDIRYAFKTFNDHFKIASNRGFELKGSVILEIGPGDSLLSGLIGYYGGIQRSILIDSQQKSEIDVNFYAKKSEGLKKLMSASRGFEICRSLNFDKVKTFESLLEATYVTYLTEGLSSFENIEESSCDLIWSQSVLQHILLDDVVELINEQKRVLKRNGMVSHSIDFKDTVAKGLNNLRFSEKIWESERIKNSGFYTNRLRLVDWINLFEKGGFTLLELRTEKWDKLPLKSKSLNRVVSEKYTEDELRICGAKLLFKL